MHPLYIKMFENNAVWKIKDNYCMPQCMSYLGIDVWYLNLRTLRCILMKIFKFTIHLANECRNIS